MTTVVPPCAAGASRGDVRAGRCLAQCRPPRETLWAASSTAAAATSTSPAATATASRPDENCLRAAADGGRGVDKRRSSRSSRSDDEGDVAGVAASGVEGIGDDGGDISGGGDGDGISAGRKLPVRRSGRSVDGRRPSRLSRRDDERDVAGVAASAVGGVGDGGGDVAGGGDGDGVAAGRKLPVRRGGRRSSRSSRPSRRDEDGDIAGGVAPRATARRSIWGIGVSRP